MLIHPWDAAIDDAEWRTWLADGRDFGQLISSGDPWPIVVPTHFLLQGDTILIHLARANPIWVGIQSTGKAVISVVDDYAFIPSGWRVSADTPADAAVPTSYYTALQLRCTAAIVDDADAKAELLTAQLKHFQPAGGYATPLVGGAHSRLLPGIRGLRLQIVEVLAKFKYDDHKPDELRLSVNDRLRVRGGGHDAAAADQQQRRFTSKG